MIESIDGRDLTLSTFTFTAYPSMKLIMFCPLFPLFAAKMKHLTVVFSRAI